jgi:hypothetical protein
LAKRGLLGVMVKVVREDGADDKRRRARPGEVARALG